MKRKRTGANKTTIRKRIERTKRMNHVSNKSTEKITKGFGLDLERIRMKIYYTLSNEDYDRFRRSSSKLQTLRVYAHLFISLKMEMYTL